MKHSLTVDTADRFARIALGHVRQEYPNKLDHVLSGPEDVRSPKQLHPIFYGSFDWHSCVHAYWLLLTLRRLFPDLPCAREIDALVDEMLTDENVAGELAYLDRAYSGGFERPYGWAWLLMLDLEAPVMEPLAREFAARFGLYLTKLTYPIRVGTHFNTAFAMTLALQWAERKDPALAALIRQRAVDYFGQDRDCQAWEPGGDEFLSSALMEALCMRKVLGEGEFRTWLGAFLPRLGERQPATLFTPAFVSDRSDGKIAHLDGLNLSRAWCWRGIGEVPELSVVASEAAEAHLDAALPHISGDYMGEHWLATFALLALSS